MPPAPDWFYEMLFSINSPVFCINLVCMLALVFLLGSSLLSGEYASASMNCTSIASVHTREVPGPLSGPEAVVAFLRIYSEDDHGKNSHACEAEYQLMIVPFTGGSASIVRLLSSNGDWNRGLSVHLDGFSLDGKSIFGIISEEGRYPIISFFSYDFASRKSELIDLKREIKSLKAAKCGTTFSVAGTTETGAIVLEPRTTDQCRESHRWVLDSATGELQPLQQPKPFEGLYGTTRTTGSR